MIDLGKGAGDAIRKAAEGRARCEAVLTQGMEKALLVIEADAKRNAPVMDGRLRASITHEVVSSPDEASGRVGTNVEYAPYVHEGTGIYAREGNGRQTPWAYKHPKSGDMVFTHGNKPNPFLRDAMDANKERIAEIFKEAAGTL